MDKRHKKRCEVISVDIDEHNGLKMLIAYYRLRLFCSTVSVFYTRHGFHIEGALNARCDPAAAVNIRMGALDDPDRIKIDERKIRRGDYRAFDRLFEIRFKGDEVYHRWEFDPLNVQLREY